jgi:hypothetical protein
LVIVAVSPSSSSLPLLPTANEQPQHAATFHLPLIPVLITDDLVVALAVAVIIAIAVAVAIAVVIAVAVAVTGAVAVTVAVAVAIKGASRDDQ